MNRASYAMVQDFLQLVLMGLLVGVLFSMAITGIVFLLSARAETADERGLRTERPAYEETELAAAGARLTPESEGTSASAQGRSPSS